MLLHCWHCRVATDDFDSSSAGWALMTVRIGPFSQCCKFLKLFACSYCHTESYLPNQQLQNRTDGPTSSCKVQGSSATSELRPKFRKTELRRQGRAAAQTRGRDGRSEHLLRAMVAGSGIALAGAAPGRCRRKQRPVVWSDGRDRESAVASERRLCRSAATLAAP